MKGCILDAGSLGPEVDLDPVLGTLEDWSIWSSTRPEEVAERIAGAGIVLSNKIRIGREHFARAKALRFISVLATGTNNVDLAAAREHNVQVSNVRAYSTDSVVQHAASLMLAMAGHLLTYAAEAKQGAWSKSPFFCHFSQPMVELAGKVLTVVGYGSQGQKLAQVASALGMTVYLADRPGAAGDSRSPSADAFTRRPFDALLPVTDVLSFHCPLTEATNNLLNHDNIFKLKRGAMVINTARGGIVNEDALVLALQRGHLGGAAIDVALVEPLPEDHPYLTVTHPNFILTPHVAWASKEARQRLVLETEANIRAFLAGAPRNLV